MKHQYTDLKQSIDLPNGVLLSLSTVGEIVAINKDGKRTTLDNQDAVRSFWHDVSDTWPEPPRIPHDPVLAAQVRQAQADIEANKPRNVTATRDADGSIRLTLDDGTVATIPAA